MFKLLNFLLLAAAAVAQLEQLDGFVQRRREIAEYYREHLSGCGLTWHVDAPGARSTSWLSTALVDPLQCGVTACELRDELQKAKIQTRRLWQPMHLSPAHRDAEAVLNGTADRLFERALSFPSTPNLTEADLRRVVKATAGVLQQRKRRVA